MQGRMNKCFYIDKNSYVVGISGRVIQHDLCLRKTETKLACIASIVPFLYLCSLNSLVVISLRRVFCFIVFVLYLTGEFGEYGEIGKN